MKFQPSYKSIWRVSFPILIAGVGETVVDVTDTIFLAHYGITELAAVGLALTIFGLALFLSLGLVDGIQIIIGRRAGEGKDAAIGEVFNQGLYLLMLVSVIMIVFIVFAVPVITEVLFASEDIHTEANAYLKFAAHALLFQSFNLAYSAFYVSISKTRVLIGATLTLAVVNIVLDYALIFGNLGFPEMGIEGAAIASLSAEIAAFCFLTAVIMWRGYNRSHKILQFNQWNPILSRQLIKLSTPISLVTLVEMVKWFLFFVIIERLGEHQLAIATIVYSCYSLLLIPTDSYSESACSMTSNLIGQQKSQLINLMIRRISILSFVSVFPFLILTLLFPESVLTIFTEDIDLISASINSLSVITLAVLVATPAETLYSTLVGTGDTLAMLIIQLVITLLTLSFAYIAAFVLDLELEYIWLAEVLGWLICLLLSWIWFKSGRWQRLKI